MGSDLMEILVEFGGGRGGGPGSVAVRFLLPTAFWLILVHIAFLEWRKAGQKKDLYVWLAGLTGMLRELLMFTAEFGSWRGWVPFVPLYRFYPPLEHAATMLSVLFIGSAFLNYLGKWERFARNFLIGTIGTTLILYGVTAISWPRFLAAHPGAPFGIFLGDLAFRITASLFIAILIAAFLLARRQRKRVTLPLLLGFAFFFLDEFLMICNLASGERHVDFLAPVRHNLHIWAIPFIIGVYWADLRRQMEEALARAKGESEKSAAIIAAIGDGVSIQDREFKVVFQNRLHKEMIGDHPGAYCYQAYEHNERVCEDCPVALSFSDGEVHIAERRVALPDRLLFVEITAAPIHDESGAIVAGVEVVRDVTDRKLNETRINQLNAELEQRVAERTALLNLANQEMESFCYSVSHDLRAPLRHLNGYSEILMEEHGESLDGQGRNYLRRICSASNRMGQLIDDLLGLSHLTRTELRVTEVNLTEMAREVMGEILELEPERQIDFACADGVWVRGDKSLLRLVLQNLLVNAWKYTSKKDGAVRIEFGATEWDGKPVCHVRDNGAGFDMRYGEKLFKAFQRLHSADQFEGNGIGLATVQRIVHRHGGRVWAEGVPDQGATFYFTLN